MPPQSPSVVIIGAHYWPDETGIAPYTTTLAEWLQSRDIPVTVLTTFSHYPAYEWSENLSWTVFRQEVRNGVVIRRFRVPLPRGRSALRRIIYDSSFIASSLLVALGVRGPRLVIAISPPIQIGLAGKALARLHHIPLVLLVKDLHVDLSLGVNMLSAGVVYRLGRRLERFVYRRADKVVVLNDAFRLRVLTDGVTPERVAMIPDWAHADLISPRPPEPRYREMLGAPNGVFLVVHTGNMGAKQDLDTVISAGLLLGASSRYRFALVGDGSERPRLERLISQTGASNVAIVGIQPEGAYPSLLAASEVCILSQRANVKDSVVPSKLLSYMAAGRPIIAAAAATSAAAQLIRDAGCGLVIEPEDPKAMASAVIALCNDPALRVRLGAAGRSYVTVNFDRAKVLERWWELICDIALARGGR